MAEREKNPASEIDPQKLESWYRKWHGAYASAATGVFSNFNTRSMGIYHHNPQIEENRHTEVNPGIVFMGTGMKGSQPEDPWFKPNGWNELNGTPLYYVMTRTGVKISFGASHPAGLVDVEGRHVRALKRYLGNTAQIQASSVFVYENESLPGLPCRSVEVHLGNLSPLAMDVGKAPDIFR